MITLGWLPMFLGFGITSALVAFDDFRMRKIHDWDWLPALLGFIPFFWGASPVVFVYVGVFAVLALSASFAVLWFFTAKVGGADWIALGLFSAWPRLMVVSTVLALSVGILGHHRKWWNRGLRAIPLAGLMGVFALCVLGYYALF